MVRCGSHSNPAMPISPTMTDRSVRPAPNLRNPIHLLAFGLGSGVLPYAPGTFGTLVAVPLYLLLAPLPLAAYLGTVLLGFCAGIWPVSYTHLRAHET